jgi:hypothetical protein
MPAASQLGIAKNKLFLGSATEHKKHYRTLWIGLIWLLNLGRSASFG